MLWLENSSVSIPDLCSTILAHIETVSLDTDLCGLTKLINNCCSSPRIVSVQFKYSFSVFMGHMPQSCLNSWIVIADAGCPGFGVTCQIEDTRGVTKVHGHNIRQVYGLSSWSCDQ